MRKPFVVAGLILGMICPGDACTVEQVISNIRVADILNSGDRAKQQLPILAALGRLNEKSKIPGRPISEQLTPKEVEDFARLSQRLSSVELNALLESAWVRDATIVGDLFAWSVDLYNGKREPAEGEAGYDRYSLLMFFRGLNKAEDMNPRVPTPSEAQMAATCSFVVALHEIEYEAMTKLNKTPVTEAIVEVERIKARNGGSLDRSKLNFQDRAILDRIQRTVYVPAGREAALIDDMENLKTLARVAEMKFEAGKKDAADSGGDIVAVGTTIDQMKLDTRTIVYLNILKIVAESNPSEWAKRMGAISSAVEAVNKKAAPLSQQPLNVSPPLPRARQ